MEFTFGESSFGTTISGVLLIIPNARVINLAGFYCLTKLVFCFLGVSKKNGFFILSYILNPTYLST
jgi:hypothetical protein